jgi:hypothetical protein|tara:strand:- start:885 stop:1973 length:1089 start_codon:yes stop_codon:yes gene_type:complete
MGFIGFTAWILWSVNSVNSTNVIEQSVPDSTEQVSTTETSEDPLWMKYMPKTSVEKRDAIRTSRQSELASMIEELRGVKKASVVLSDEAQHGIGQPHRNMSACVMVEPSSNPLTTATLDAIRTIVSDATSGLDAPQVNVINTTLGVVSVGVPSWESEKMSAKEIRGRVEDAIGLSIAAVSVTMQRGNSIMEYIPWLDDATPLVRVSLPRSWIEKRSRQVGSNEIVFGSINNLIYEVVPDADVEILAVKGTTSFPASHQADESYAKQLGLIVGLIALLISGFANKQRRRKEETVVLRNPKTPEEEAMDILKMEHAFAKLAIDSLEGARKIEVLQAIVSSELPKQEVPVVEVAKGKQLELTKCG